VSRYAIWSLNAKRSELGGARKWQIYLFKASTGGVVAALLAVPLLFDQRAIVIASAAVFVTTKVCYYVNTGERPDHWTSVCDWLTDGALHLLWFALWCLARHDYGTAALLLSGLLGYPWSSE
jgi:hypothetical protein